MSLLCSAARLEIVVALVRRVAHGCAAWVRRVAPGSGARRVEDYELAAQVCLRCPLVSPRALEIAIQRLREAGATAGCKKQRGARVS